MNLHAEITDVVNRYIEHVTGAVRERAKGLAMSPKWYEASLPSVTYRKKKAKAKAKAKAKRGPRHCGKCGSAKHDARNHDAATKGAKKAALYIAKAA